MDELSPEDGDVVIVSSGLSAFDNPLLEEELRNRGVRDVLVCGMSGDVGVESLMRDAYEKGFNVFAVADCIASSSNEAQKVLLEESLPMIGITVTTHKEVSTPLSLCSISSLLLPFPLLSLFFSCASMCRR